MTTAAPDSGGRLGGPAVVRAATPADTLALYQLSSAFVPSGALRGRPLAHYARHAGDFLVAETVAGQVEGCVAVRFHQDRSSGHGGLPRTGPSGTGRAAVVLYNFCVASGSQGRGIGSALLRAALSKTGTHPVFTATTGDGELFLRHGFQYCDASTAPVAWAATLDPRRGSRILTRSAGSPCRPAEAPGHPD
ncbi:GNAT family N-acetyltransferase [Streptomyces sp. NPDC026673]|uniref:GNAT family N-acetyltransferase n=1 Tax=Streptomyces sp. NPDC026673 TaxID=3155724 RepID=UPI0033EA531A